MPEVPIPRRSDLPLVKRLSCLGPWEPDPSAYVSRTSRPVTLRFPATPWHVGVSNHERFAQPSSGVPNVHVNGIS